MAVRLLNWVAPRREQGTSGQMTDNLSGQVTNMVSPACASVSNSINIATDDDDAPASGRRRRIKIEPACCLSCTRPIDAIPRPGRIVKATERRRRLVAEKFKREVFIKPGNYAMDVSIGRVTLVVTAEENRAKRRRRARSVALLSAPVLDREAFSANIGASSATARSVIDVFTDEWLSTVCLCGDRKEQRLAWFDAATAAWDARKAARCVRTFAGHRPETRLRRDVAAIRTGIEAKYHGGTFCSPEHCAVLYFGYRAYFAKEQAAAVYVYQGVAWIENSADPAVVRHRYYTALAMLFFETRKRGTIAQAHAIADMLAAQDVARTTVQCTAPQHEAIAS